MIGGDNFVRPSILVDADSPEPWENQVDVDDLADVACQKKNPEMTKNHNKSSELWQIMTHET